MISPQAALRIKAEQRGLSPLEELEIVPPHEVQLTRGERKALSFVNGLNPIQAKEMFIYLSSLEKVAASGDLELRVESTVLRDVETLKQKGIDIIDGKSL